MDFFVTALVFCAVFAVVVAVWVFKTETGGNILDRLLDRLVGDDHD